MTLPKKRANPWNKKLTGAQGSIEIPESLYTQDFAETAPTYQHGSSGTYFNNPIAERHFVQSDEFVESSFAESGVLSPRKLTAEQKVLWRMVEGHIGGELSVQQRKDLSQWMARPKHLQIARVLTNLRNKSGMTNAERAKKLTYEVYAQELMTSLTRLLRSE